MSQIYLGGPCDSEHRTLMVRAAEALRNIGHDVYCPFELKIEIKFIGEKKKSENR